MSTVRQRRGFSLLEVMVALGILMVSLAVLVESQSGAAVMTRMAEEIITGSDLAQAKINEVLVIVEAEGFQQSDQHESGDFDDFGDDALNLEIGEELENYHWEYWVSEIDLALAGEIAAMMGEVDSTGFLGGGGGGGGEGGGGEGGSAADAAGGLGLGALGIGGGQITEMIGPYIREVRVRVWWGDDSERAEELGNEIYVTTHVINPSGVLSLTQSLEGGGE